MLFLSIHKTFLNTNLSSWIIRSLDRLLEFCEVLIGAILDKTSWSRLVSLPNNHLIKLCENSRFEQFRKGANSSRNNDYPRRRRAALFIFVLLGKQTTERVTLCFAEKSVQVSLAAAVSDLWVGRAVGLSADKLVSA